METFVSFELAKKLKEKGFVCDLPFAMYNELGQFYLLTTSAPIRKAESGYTYRDYYDYEDFDENDFIAPTISQVLKWLREVKRIDAGAVWDNRDGKWVGYINEMDMPDLVGEYVLPNSYDAYEQAVIASIEYVLDNLI